MPINKNTFNPVIENTQIKATLIMTYLPDWKKSHMNVEQRNAHSTGERIAGVPL